MIAEPLEQALYLVDRDGNFYANCPRCTRPHRSDVGPRLIGQRLTCRWCEHRYTVVKTLATSAVFRAYWYSMLARGLWSGDDSTEVLLLAGDEIWRSMRKWDGDPTGAPILD